MEITKMIVMGLTVEAITTGGPLTKQEKVRVKLLGMPGEHGPEMIMDRSVALDLAKAIIVFMETGTAQDINYVLRSHSARIWGRVKI
jgi:hypothetical protein